MLVSGMVIPLLNPYYKLNIYIDLIHFLRALIIFWLFPTVFILGLTSIDSLSEKIKFLQQFLQTPIIKALLQNVLPTVLVSAFMAILPWILMGLYVKFFTLSEYIYLFVFLKLDLNF